MKKNNLRFLIGALVILFFASCEKEIDVVDIDIPPTVAIQSPSDSSELDVLGSITVDVHDDFELASATITVTEANGTKQYSETFSLSGKDATVTLTAPPVGTFKDDGIGYDTLGYNIQASVTDANGSITLGQSVYFDAVITPKIIVTTSSSDLGGTIVTELTAGDNNWFTIANLEDTPPAGEVYYTYIGPDGSTIGPITSSAIDESGIYWFLINITGDGQGGDQTTQEIKIESVGLIGPGTTGGWSDEQYELTQSEDDPAIWVASSIELTSSDPEFKARANDAWDVAWGSPNWPSGTASFAPGAPNFVAGGSGTFDFELNIITGDYTITEN